MAYVLGKVHFGTMLKEGLYNWKMSFLGGNIEGCGTSLGRERQEQNTQTMKYVTVYAEIGHLSAKLNFKYAPCRQKRNGLVTLRFFSSQGLVWILESPQKVWSRRNLRLGCNHAWKAAVAIDRGSLTTRISRTKLAYGLS